MFVKTLNPSPPPPQRLMRLTPFVILWALSPTLKGVDDFINIQTIYRWALFLGTLFFNSCLHEFQKLL